MNRINLRERQLEVREQAILEAAHALMAERGFEAMTMDDVAAAVGISKATLYQHFESKETLGVRVVIGALERLERRIREQDLSLPAIQRLEGAVRSVIQQRFAGRRRDLQVARPVLYAHLRDHPDFKKLHELLIASVAALLEEAKRDGDVAAGVSATVTAVVLLNVARNADYEWLLASGQCTLEELEDTVTTLLFEGLRVRAGSPGADE